MRRLSLSRKITRRVPKWALRRLTIPRSKEMNTVNKARADKKKTLCNKEKHASKNAKDKKKTPANKEKYAGKKAGNGKKAEAVTGDVVLVNSVSYGWWPGCKLSQNGPYYSVKLLALNLAKSLKSNKLMDVLILLLQFSEA